MINWPKLNFLLLATIVAVLTYLLFRHVENLPILKHDFLAYDVQPHRLTVGEPQVLRFDITVDRKVPPNCRLVIDRIISDKNGNVVASQDAPGSVAVGDVGIFHATNRWTVTPPLPAGCYRVQSRATTDCGLVSLTRTTPTIQICVDP